MKVLRSCSKILFGWEEFEASERRELLSLKDKDFHYIYIEPFSLELGEKILNARIEERKDIVTFYIFHLNRSAYTYSFYGNVYDFLDYAESSPISYIDISENFGTEGDQSIFIMVHFLYMHLFNNIQSLCNIFNIPFFEICDDLDFTLGIINTKITTEYEVKKKELETKKLQGTSSPEIIQPKTSKLRNELKKHGFFGLKMVKDLSDSGSEKLIGFISSNDLPYQIAMLNFLGFIKYVDKEYCHTKTVLYQTLADILSNTPRAVRGNILVLNDNSREDKRRFTSHKNTEIVKKDYEKIN